MSTLHPATSSLANFKNTISTISTSRFFIYISSRQEPTFVMASQLELFLPANSYTTHLLSSTRATNEGIAVLEVWSIFPFVIKCILGIKCIFSCSFANKRMCLLTRVYGMLTHRASGALSPTSCIMAGRVLSTSLPECSRRAGSYNSTARQMNWEVVLRT